MRRARRYPHCRRCGIEMDPRRYEDCQRAYETAEGVLCRMCFLEEAEEYLRLDTEGFAALVGARVVELE